MLQTSVVRSHVVPSLQRLVGYFEAGQRVAIIATALPAGVITIAIDTIRAFAWLRGSIRLLS